MLIAKVRNTLSQDRPKGQRLCITKKLELFMKIIIQLKGNSFHSSAKYIFNNAGKGCP